MERRNTNSRLKISLNNAEREQITAMALSVRMSVAGFVRAAALGKELRTTMDHQAIRDLIALHGDLGRLGGLLKLWLAERKGEGVEAAKIDTLYAELADLKKVLSTKIEALI
jgi:hypothetical protein